MIKETMLIITMILFAILAANSLPVAMNAIVRQAEDTRQQKADEYIRTVITASPAGQ